jgi:hypothetical protein
VITVIGNWEQNFSEYDQIIEYRIWKQTIAAFEVDRWMMVGPGPDRVTAFEAYESMGDALSAAQGTRVFMLHTADGPLKNLDVPEDVVIIFGSPDENLAAHVRPGDFTALLPTPFPADMYAAGCLAWALSKWR